MELCKTSETSVQTRGYLGKPFLKCSYWFRLQVNILNSASRILHILGDLGAVSRVDKMFVVKVYCEIETSPWGSYSYRTSSRSVWIARFWLARKKSIFWPISEEKLPGDSRVFLHDVVFQIDGHSRVARSTGKVSRRKFQNKMLTIRKIATFTTATRNKHSPMNF